MSVITVNGLSKSFKGQYALKDASFVIKSNKITGLVGPDGSGKTTLIRILTGLLDYEAEEIDVLGYDLKKSKRNIQELIGYMPQKFGLYEDLSVQENMQLYAKLQSIPHDLQSNRIDELLEFTGLINFRDFLASELSGGMKQKLGLACSLIKKPKLLLLDEPGVGVDPISRKELWSMVESLTSEGVSVVWSTAYLDEAELCEDVILLNEGKILFNGSPKLLKDSMNGKTFVVEGEIEDKRKTLSSLLSYEYVKDALILGERIKFIMDDTKQMPSLKKIDAPCAVIRSMEPSFEDGFMNILGADSKAKSPLEEFIQPVVTHNEYVIEVEGLSKVFGSFKAAENISFCIKKGEIFGLLGPNGAGKSTIFKMLCGLIRPSSGKADILGYSFEKSSLEARTKIGYMSQKFSLYGDITVLENLRFFAGVYKLRGEYKRFAIEKMLDIFDLKKYKHSASKELPLGYKQRLSLACAIMHNPSILFLDEPTSGVDPLTRREFWNHIYTMVQKGVTVMVTTHFMQEAEYCDNIALIYKGSAIAIDTPHNLTHKVSDSASMQDAFIELIKRDEDEVK
jgi:ABC-2 type transport system ATP-binding protein